jgi:hypothetical protein
MTGSRPCPKHRGYQLHGCPVCQQEIDGKIRQAAR